MGNYGKAAGVQLKYHLKVHILAAVLFFCLMPFLMGTRYLGPSDSAKTLEMYAALCGIIFLVPVFMPDMDRDIRDLLRSKQMSMTALHVIRLLEGLAATALFAGAAVLYLLAGGCRFPWLPYFWGTFAEAVFLGGLGMCVFAVTDNPAVGYMIPLVYYMINFSGDRYVKDFYLFSMMGGDYGPKYVLAAAGALLLAAGILWRRKRP